MRKLSETSFKLLKYKWLAVWSEISNYTILYVNIDIIVSFIEHDLLRLLVFYLFRLVEQM